MNAATDDDTSRTSYHASYNVPITHATLAALRASLNIPYHVNVTLTVDAEDMPPDEQIDDAETVAWIREELSSGNDAAWFCATVTVSDEDAEGIDHLGGCSSESFNDFMTIDGNLPDMVAAAFAEYTTDAARLAVTGRVVT